MPRILGIPGIPHPIDAREQLAPELRSFLEALIEREGVKGAARALKTSPPTIDLALSRGVKKGTLERLEGALRTLVDAELATKLGAELLA